LRQENMLPPQVDGEAVAVGSMQVRRCEIVIATLGEDGVKPLAQAEMQKLQEKASPPGSRDPFRPVLIGDALLDWSAAEAIGLSDLKAMLPAHEVLMALYIDGLAGMGAKVIPRTMLVAAGNDRKVLEGMEDEISQERVIASRLKALNNYMERKLYALSLGVMAYQE
jgi:hypothetical protein